MMRLCCWLVLFNSTSLLAVDLSTIQGKKFSCEVTGFSPQAIEIKSSSSSKSFTYTEILAIEYGNPFIAEVVPFIEVELTDGSTFRCKDFVIRGKSIELTLLSGAIQPIPLLQIQSILRDANDLKNKLDFRTIVKNTRADRRDVYVRSVPDGAGKRLDFLGGTFGQADETGQKISFERAGGGKLNVFQKSIHGVFLNQIAVTDRIPTLCKVYDIHRNVIYAKTLAIKDGKLVVNSVSGLEYQFADSKSVSKLDFSSSSLRYLSDMEPSKVEESSTEDLIFSYSRDKNLDNQPIRLQNVAYSKGLSIHSRSSLTYEFNSDYKEFRTIAGVDDSVETDSVVSLIIEADGREVFRKQVKKKDAPHPIVLDVQNIKQLKITVEAAVLDLGNQLTLADVRVLK
jgi:hypothetical protein